MGANFKNKGDAIRVEFAAGATYLRPATFEPGDPILLGNRPGVAKTARDSNSTTATIWFYGTYEDVPINPTGPVKAGQVAYFDQDRATTTPRLTDRTAPGFRWGYFEEAGIAGDRIRVTVGY